MGCKVRARHSIVYRVAVYNGLYTLNQLEISHTCNVDGGNSFIRVGEGKQNIYHTKWDSDKISSQPRDSISSGCNGESVLIGLQ